MIHDIARSQSEAGSAANSSGDTHLKPVRALVRNMTVGRDLWRIHGTAKFFGRILPWTYHRRYLLYEGSPALELPAFPTSIPLRLAVAEPEDMPLLLSARRGYYDLRQLHRRLSQGHVCFIAWHGREPIGIRWAFRGSVHLPYLSRTLVLGPTEVYFDEVYTVPHFRRRGVDDQNYRFMLSWFKAQGFRTHLCLLTSWDTYLHRRYESFRMRRTGEIRRVGFPGGKRYRLEGRLRESAGDRISLA